jgi:hypothetical protein
MFLGALLAFGCGGLRAAGAEPLPLGVGLGRVWHLMFALENPLGRSINFLILFLFAIAVIELALAVRQIATQSHRLRAAERAFARLGDEPFPTSEVACLHALELDVKGGESLLAQRVRVLFRLRLKRIVDVSILRELTGGRVGVLGGFSRFVAGSLTVLGLVGTVLGLSLAVGDLAPLIARIESARDITIFSGQMLHTLAAMETAFSCTLTGLLCAFLLSVTNFVVQRQQSDFFQRLEEFCNLDLVPAILPVAADDAAEDFSSKLLEAGAKVSHVVEQLDAAAQKFADGGRRIEGVTPNIDNLGNAASQLQRTSDRFAEAVEMISKQNAEQLGKWGQVSSELTATVEALRVQVSGLSAAASAMQASADALKPVARLPEDLERVLGDAMRSAIVFAQEQQEGIAKPFLDRLEEFQKSYADLVLGVQTSVSEMLHQQAARGRPDLDRHGHFGTAEREGHGIHLSPPPPPAA